METDTESLGRLDEYEDVCWKYSCNLRDDRYFQKNPKNPQRMAREVSKIKRMPRCPRDSSRLLWDSYLNSVRLRFSNRLQKSSGYGNFQGGYKYLKISSSPMFM